MKNYLFLAVFFLTLISCKSKQQSDQQQTSDTQNQLPKDVNKPLDDPLTFFTKVIIPPKFDQLKISSKITIESQDSYLPTLDAIVYIEQDTKIWMKISAFMINMARGLATPEGIKAYVNTEKKYIDSDFQYINNLLNTNFIDYKSLEKIFLGRTMVKINQTQYKITRNAQGFKVVSLVNQKIETEQGAREYKIEFQYSPLYDLQTMVMKDVNSTDELTILYDQWEPYKNFRLPKNVKIIIKGAKQSQILLENTKFDDSKMQTPFSIPGNYTKIEIR